MASSVAFILFTLLYLSYNVSGRTCVCAEFRANECDKMMNCKFNLKVPTVGDVQGSHGMCRSLRWYTCHVDPKCTIRYRDPTSDWDLIDDDALPDEYDVMDWPWECDSGDYAEHIVNIQSYEKEFNPQQLQKIDDLEQVIEEVDAYDAINPNEPNEHEIEAFIFKPGHEGSHMKLASEITCGVLVIGFIFMISAIVLVLKCKEHCNKLNQEEMDPLLAKV